MSPVRLSMLFIWSFDTRPGLQTLNERSSFGREMHVNWLTLTSVMRTVVLTDSSCDLTPAQAAELGIYLLPLTVHFAGRSWRAPQALSNSELFERVAAGAELPSTSPPELQEYHAVLETLLGQAEHVFCIHLSHHLSATYAVAVQAARAFPGRVTVHDSLNVSGALALQAERAVRLLALGETPQQVSEILTALQPLARAHMCLTTLDYLQKNGRIGRAASLLGGLLNVNPILGLDQGVVEPYGRPRGEHRALQQLRQLLAQYVQGAPEGRIAFFHNGHPKGVEALRHYVARLGVQQTLTLDMGPVLSAHVGPGVFGFVHEPIKVWHKFREY